MESTAADADTGSSGPSSSTVGSDSEGEGETSHAVCGDGVVEGEEVCDDGVNDGSYGGCAPDCRSLGPYCGDGVKNGDEECDDGDDVNGNGCNNDCIESGKALWTRTFAGDVGARGYGVAIGPDDSVVVTGEEILSSRTRAWAGLYDADGDMQWSSYYEPSNTGDSGSAAVAANASRIITVGLVQSNSLLAWMQELSPDGIPEWTTTAGQGLQGLNLAYGAALSASFAYVAGVLDSSTWLTKRNSNGGEVWTRSGPAGGLRGVAVDTTGDIVVAGGRTFSPPSTDFSVWIRKYTSEGQTVWTHEGDPDAGNLVQAVSTGPSNEIIVAGQRNGVIWLARHDANGSEEWATVMNGSGYADQAHGVVVDSSGDIVVVGEFERAIWIRKYDPTGTPRWTDVVGGALSGSEAWAVAVDSMDNVLVAGTLGQGGNVVGWVRKYTP